MKSLTILLPYLFFLTAANAAIQGRFCAFDETNYAWTGGGAYPRITVSNEKIYLISDVSGVWQANLSAPFWEKG